MTPLYDELNKIVLADYSGNNKDAKLKMKHGELVTGSLTSTEDWNRTRITVTNSLEDYLENASTDASEFVTELKKEIENRINEDKKVELVRSTFVNFDESSLE